jgi:hypothetical protein
VDIQTEQRYKNSLKLIINAIVDKSTRLVPQYEKINAIFIHIEKYEKIMQKYMEIKISNGQTEDFPDHHKIAAAFCCSVIKARPINYVMDKSGVASNPYEQSANELCAYLFGLQVIQNFWSDKVNENIPADEKDIYSKPIRTPEPNDPDTTYQDWVTKLLKKGAAEHFDYEHPLFGEKLIFFIAHLYFMIESFSFRYYKAGGA